MHPNIDAIIDKLEAIEEPSRHLDLEIAVEIGFMVYFEEDGIGSYFYADEPHPKSAAMSGRADTPFIPGNGCPAYTASVDAALSILDRVLPGWMIEHAGDNAVGAPGRLKVFGHTVDLTDERSAVQGDSPVRAVAYCLAFLNAIKRNRERFEAELWKEIGPAFQEVDAAAAEAIRKDVSAVLACLLFTPKMPEIEYDDDSPCLVLRWMPDDASASFSLTFVGKGQVGGYLSAPRGAGLPAWRLPTRQRHDLLSRLNDRRVQALTCVGP
jgi:hypothetical protein